MDDMSHKGFQYSDIIAARKIQNTLQKQKSQFF